MKNLKPGFVIPAELLDQIGQEYTEREDYPFHFLDDNGDYPDGNSYIILEDDCDSTLLKILEKYEITPVTVCVFDNKEDAYIQGQDGGLTCFYTSRDQYLVML